MSNRIYLAFMIILASGSLLTYVKVYPETQIAASAIYLVLASLFIVDYVKKGDVL